MIQLSARVQLNLLLLSDNSDQTRGLETVTSASVDEPWVFIVACGLFQAATVSLQGFLNSMVYAWRRPNFTVAVLGERTPLLGDQHLAFFEESLTDSK